MGLPQVRAPYDARLISPVRYRMLGTTGLAVSALGLGAMKFGGRFNSDLDECRAIVHRALDAGINLIDTADIYGRGDSERIVGAALEGRRDDVVVATKVHHAMGDDPNMRGNSKRWLARACEESLTRLRTDHIDLYQLHRPDPACSLEESIDGLNALVDVGKIRYFGTSTFPASQLVEAQWIARAHRMRRPSTEQPPYSILVRGVEADVLPTCQRHGIGVLSYSPLAGGWLAKPATRHSLPVMGAGQREDQYQLKVAAALEVTHLAAQAGTNVAHLALGWVLEHPAISSAIIGPRTLEQLDGLLPAAEASMSPELVEAIDSVVAPGTTLVDDDAGNIWRYGTRISPYPDGWRRAIAPEVGPFA